MSRKFLQRTFSILLVAGMLLGFIAPGSVRANAPLAPVAQTDPTAKFEQLVLDQLNAGQADFFVVMTEQADLSAADQLQTKDEKGQFVFAKLIETAERSQADLRAYLKDQGVDFKTFYIVNAILVKGGNLDLAMAIANRADVGMIYANHQYQLEEPMITKGAANSPTGVEPNITFVKAPDVWAMGITGQGTIVAGNDTGLDETHPAIARHYRGCVDPPTCTTFDNNYNWWDATGTYPLDPWDGFGHGTHTTGTMVGDDGVGNQVGVAPGAQTIHCKNMTDGGSGDDNTFLTCFQWDLAPWDLTGANPRPDLAPDAINNSWGYWGGGANQFRTAIDNLQAAGILVEVSAGNEGAGCQTLRSPGDYQEVLTTGSVNHTTAFPGLLTGFSSRGPSSLDPGNYFPDIMAPGENIRSSVPGGGFEGGWSGTSMAGPHATALVGLMWSACPSLRGQVAQTIEMIHATASPLTGQGGSNCGGDYTVGPNNDWGFGTIDDLAAVEMAVATCTGVGTLEGTITDASTTNPLESAHVEANWEGGFSYFDTTDLDGFYSMLVPEGNYTVTASLFGYIPGTANVVVVTDTTTVQNFALVPAVSYEVEGTVTDDETGWPLYAKISIDGYPGDPIWTNPVDGSYSITLPEGILYTFHVQAFVTGYVEESRDIGPLTGDLTEDFALLADQGACSAPGRHPDCYWFENFEGTDGGFTTGGTTTFAWGVPTSGPGEAHSGDYVWATNPAGQYNNSENGWVESPNIDLSGLVGQGVLFSWWQYLVSESNYDYASVLVSNDGGATWTPVYGPISGSIDDAWTRHETILDPSYAVSNFRVRYYFTSDSSVTYDGWYIDDICFVGVPPPLEVYTENFDADNGGFSTYGALSTWAWGAPTSGPGTAHSAPNVWATNLAGNYNTNEDSYVESPDIDLSAYAGSSIYVRWWQWLQTESCCDYGALEVSKDGGTNWAVIYGPAYGNVDLSWAQHLAVVDPTYAVNNFRMRFHLYTDYSVEYPGYYVDDISISVGAGAQIPCVVDPGGLVVGNVYDDNTNLPLVGATVMSAEGAGYVTVATPEDPNVDDGFYTLFGSPGAQDFTASKSDYASDVENVTVIDGDTVLQNFFLGAGFLDWDPDSLHVTVEFGAMTDTQLTLSNLGAAPLTFEISEKDRGFTPAIRISIPRFEGTIPPDVNPPSTGLAPTPGITTPGGSPLGGSIQGVQAFGNDAYPTGDLITFDSETPGTFTSIANLFPGAGDFLAGADFLNGDFSTLYAVTYGSNQLLAIDTTTGAMTVIGPSIPGGGESWSGMTASNDGTLYGSAAACGASSTLYTIDPDDGTVTPVGSITNGPCIIDIAINAAGEMYGVDLVNDVLVQIDPATGAGTVIGPVGINANYAQGMDFEDESGILYWAAYSTSGELRIIDTSTGASTLVGAFQGGDEVDGLAFASGGVLDVPWLSESPITGTIPAAPASQPIDVTFDSSVVNQPGDYFADLKINTDTPYGGATVPVTMTVLAPDTWGKLDGTVTDLCTGDPIEEAQVDILNGDPITQTLTDEAGYYWAWLEQGTYSVTYSLAGYVTYNDVVDILPGQTTSKDVELVPDRACITVEPNLIEAWVLTDTTVYTTGGIAIGNIGAQDLTWEIREKDLGYSPTGTLGNTVPPAPLPPVENPGSTSLVGVTGTGTAPQGGQPDAWFNAAPMPGAGLVRYAHAQCPEDLNNFYVISGVEDGTIVDYTFGYNAETNSWTTLAPYPDATEGPTSVCYEGKIYVVGGVSYTTLSIYDIATNTWSHGANAPRPAWGAAMGAFEGMIYFVGGDPDFFFGGTSNVVNIYDIATDTWTGTGTPMPTARSTPGYFQLGNYLYVVGGWGDLAPGSNANVTERYDMSIDAWEVGPAFSIAKADFGLAATSQYLYAIGGDSDGGGPFDASNSVWALDWTLWPSGAWFDIADPLSVGVTANNGGFATDAVTGGEIWTAGGVDISFFWHPDTVYRPSEPPWTPVPTDVPWVWEVPVSGTVTPDGTQDVGVYFTSISGTVPLPLGTYTATLRIINNDSVAGVQSVTVIMHIVSEYISPTVSFTSNSPVMLGETMIFTNTSSDPGIPPVTEYTWDFGDGVTMTVGTMDPVTHVYDMFGTYTVTLTACNVAGCSIFTADVYVEPLIMYMPLMHKS
jgi:Subtilase family/PKD domain/Carboxypeptidase regulatory-like domain/Repeat of unknown function (DUF6923)/Kelch motif